MKYHYKAKTADELEAIAASLLARFPFCVKNEKPDIEGIVEHSGLQIIARPGLNKQTVLDAFLPRVTGFIIIDADLSADLAAYRLTLAEEMSHRLLEPDLWKQAEPGGTVAPVPAGANIYELDKHLYDEIEGDAYRLAIAILMPEKCFRERFYALKGQLRADDTVKDLDELTIDMLAREFGVTYNACASRCEKLNICRGKVRKKELPGAVIF